MRVFLLLCSLLCLTEPAALSQDFSSMEGTYEVEQKSDMRTANVSRITLESVKGQPRLHAWFYGQPKDIDWGTDNIKFYKIPGNSGFENWSVQLRHDANEAILIVEPNALSKQLVVKSFIFYTASDQRHPNIAITDVLRRVGTDRN